jgi:hypothetical protein
MNRSTPMGETSVLRLGGGGGGGGGGEHVLPDQRGVAEVVLDGRTFQSLIEISFPKIVGERGEAGEISGHSIIFH